MPSDREALDKLSEGRRLMQARDFGGAIACFDEVMALNPEPLTLGSAHLNRLDALRKLGRHQEAEAAERNWESLRQTAMQRSQQHLTKQSAGAERRERLGQVGDRGRESGHATVRALALIARQEYGSLDRFVDQVVVAEVVKAGLYTREQGLTLAGEAERADLEGRVGAVLREMQLQRGSWMEKEPHKALMAAVLAVALGRRRPTTDGGLQPVWQQVDQGAAMAETPYGTGDQSGIWYDWYFFSHYDRYFDRYFDSIDSEVDSAGAGGDGGDGGDGGE